MINEVETSQGSHIALVVEVLDLGICLTAVGDLEPQGEVAVIQADSREKYRKVEDFYDKGDVAPLGRLNFVYRGE